ncbi:hypothetical protein [Roseovarius aestuariivivens]|uniref:hypothetical protein n=1 Tax=Roseovarius aestuariivivens TaxID=1888910 RepID=UPI00108079AD|nr:hypothetical protein [Roseovarius aestuariivivens]
MRLRPQQEFDVRSPLLDFLLTAETRPGMYYGAYELGAVHKTLHGWMMHRAVTGDDDPFAELFADFHAFVSQRLGDDRSCGWAAMIAAATPSDRDAFALFMTLVRELAATRFAPPSTP